MNVKGKSERGAKWFGELSWHGDGENKIKRKFTNITRPHVNKSPINCCCCCYQDFHLHRTQSVKEKKQIVDKFNFRSVMWGKANSPEQNLCNHSLCYCFSCFFDIKYFRCGHGKEIQGKSISECAKGESSSMKSWVGTFFRASYVIQFYRLYNSIWPASGSIKAQLLLDWNIKLSRSLVVMQQ